MRERLASLRLQLFEQLTNILHVSWLELANTMNAHIRTQTPGDWSHIVQGKGLFS
jgi:hypothetical protein